MFQWFAHQRGVVDAATPCGQTRPHPSVSPGLSREEPMGGSEEFAFRANLVSIGNHDETLVQPVSCVLRASGTEFDPEAFLVDSELTANPVYRRGEPKPGEGTWQSSGFQVGVSQAELSDLPGQIRDAVRFLSLHEEELQRLGRFEGVESVCIDFAIDRRDVAVQTDVFDAELLWRAGALDIDLVVSHYAS